MAYDTASGLNLGTGSNLTDDEIWATISNKDKGMNQRLRNEALRSGLDNPNNFYTENQSFIDNLRKNPQSLDTYTDQEAQSQGYSLLDKSNYGLSNLFPGGELVKSDTGNKYLRGQMITGFQPWTTTESAGVDSEGNPLTKTITHNQAQGYSLGQDVGGKSAILDPTGKDTGFFDYTKYSPHGSETDTFNRITGNSNGVKTPAQIAYAQDKSFLGDPTYGVDPLLYKSGVGEKNLSQLSWLFPKTPWGSHIINDNGGGLWPVGYGPKDENAARQAIRGEGSFNGVDSYAVANDMLPSMAWEQKGGSTRYDDPNRNSGDDGFLGGLGEVLGPIASIASFIPGPWQPVAQMYNAFSGLASGNPLAVLSIPGVSQSLGLNSLFEGFGNDLTNGAGVGPFLPDQINYGSLVGKALSGATTGGLGSLFTGGNALTGALQGAAGNALRSGFTGALQSANVSPGLAHFSGSLGSSLLNQKLFAPRRR